MTSPLPKIPDLPPVRATDPTQVQRFLDAVREIIQTREGRRGSALDESVTFRHLVDLSLAQRTAAGWLGTGGSPGPSGPAGPVGPAGDPYVPDFTAPPTPTGLAAASLFRGIFIEWDPPTYTVGHGNAYTEIFVAQYGGTGPLPTFASALSVGQAAGSTSMFTHPAAMGAQLHVWAKFVTNDDVASDVPAGGTNGVQITVGQVGTSDLGPLIVEAANLASGAVTASKLAAQAVELTKFANGIEPVTIVTGGSLPTSKSTETIFWSGKLYRWNGTAYTAEVPVVDLSGQITSTQISDGAISTPKLAANAVTATNIAAGAVTAGKIAADAVTAGTIAAGAVNAAQIAAGAITTGKLLVTGQGAALNDDPNFQDAALWVIDQGAGTFETGAGGNAEAPTFFRTTSGTSGAWVYANRHIPISAAKQYRMSARVYADPGTTGTLYLALLMFDGAGAYVGSAVTGWGGGWSAYPLAAQAPTTGDWYRYSGTFGAGTAKAIPVSVKTCYVAAILNNGGSSGPVWGIQALRLEEMVGADLIVDGAIIASKISAGAIAVGSAAIQDGAIRNALIENAAIDNAKIANVSAAKLTAGSVSVGAEIKSSNYVAGTAGWMIHGNGNAEFGFTNIRGTLQAGQIAAGYIATGMLAANAVTAAKIDSRELTIKDANGVVIFGANTSIGNDTAASLGFNPTFSSWSGTYPDTWALWDGAAPAKNTANAIGSPFCVQWTVAAADQGMSRIVSFPAPLPAGTFVTGSFNMNILANAGGGTPGYLIRLYTNSALSAYVDTVVPMTDKTVTGWQRMAFVAGANGLAVHGIQVYQMAAWSGMPGGSLAVGSVILFGPLSFTVNNPITSANASTYIAAAAIGWAQIGDLNISTGGGIRSGKSSYGTGTGWLIEYNGGTPRLDIGDASQYLRWTGTALEIKINKVTASATSVSGSSYAVDANITRIIGTSTASATGGTPPYTYQWQVAGVQVEAATADGRNYGSIQIQGTNNEQCRFLARGASNCGVYITASCTITDSNGLSGIASVSTSATFGTGPP